MRSAEDPAAGPPVAGSPAACSPAGRSPLEAEILRIRTLLEANEPAAALAAAERLRAAEPQHRDVLYVVAVSQRCLGRLADALRTLAHLEKLHPDYSRLFQERGNCLVAAHEPAGATTAFLRAVNLNPALPGSWSALEMLFRAAGHTVDANTASAHVAKLARLPQAIVVATSLFSDGDLAAAEQVVRRHLVAHGDDIEGMRLLAKIGIKLEVLDDAELLYEGALALAPGSNLLRHEYAQVLLQRHKNVRALEEAQKLLVADPLNRDFRTLRASALVALGSYDEGLRAYRELVAEAPDAADIHLSIAHVLKTLGRQSESIEAYRTAARVRPTFGDAYWSLANLKTYRFSDDEIERMRRAESNATTPLVDRYHLCFALGKAHEDRADYAASFGYYERGNALKRRESRYQLAPIARIAELQQALCTREFFAARRGGGCERPDPIFIVGLPRAGSTLLEQILASHSRVEGTLELPEIPRLVGELQGRDRDHANPRYPGVLAELTPDQLRAFGEKYLAETAVYRTGKAFFIDKMPNNFRHIGLIHLILPNARIIDARREPMACCFSNFKQLFASGQEFTYGIEDIARYYRLYVQLMAHWDAALPGKVLRVQHEDLVENLEFQVRRILDFCGLEFESACLEFYKTERGIRTASSEQVRRPIFKEGLDQWRHFEPWLGPLKQALGPLAPAS